MKCFVIAQSEKVRALSFSGIQGIETDNILNDIRTAVEEAVSDKTIGTLLISKEVQTQASDIIEKHEQRGVLPVVMLLD